MASRRMFSKEVVESSKFLKMPMTAQCLYFHLGLNADDDGVVEAYNVMNMIHSNIDDLEVLQGRGFVKILDNDYVTYIIHWLKQNQIRADRRKQSEYRELLIEVIPELELRFISENNTGNQRINKGNKNIADTYSRCVLTDNGQSIDGQMSAKCLPNDGQMSAKCLPNDGQMSVKCQSSDGELSAQYSVVECRIDKFSKGEYRVVECSEKSSTLTADEYNILVKEFPKEIVDSTIQRAQTYKNCMNYETIAQWCKEAYERKRHITSKPKPSFYCSGHHNYDYKAHESYMLNPRMDSE